MMIMRIEKQLEVAAGTAATAAAAESFPAPTAFTEGTPSPRRFARLAAVGFPLHKKKWPETQARSRRINELRIGNPRNNPR
jgi:hypothetical protein